MQSRLDSHGFIYFVESHDAAFIKIGFTANPASRISSLKTHSPGIRVLGFIHGTMRDEKSLHSRFAAHREAGEWFRGSVELRSYIQTLSLLDWTLFAAPRRFHPTRLRYISEDGLSRGEQISAARKFLRISQKELASRAGICVITVRRLEGIERLTSRGCSAVKKIREALDQLGVSMVDEEPGRYGVILRK